MAEIRVDVPPSDGGENSVWLQRLIGLLREQGIRVECEQESLPQVNGGGKAVLVIGVAHSSKAKYLTAKYIQGLSEKAGESLNSLEILEGKLGYRFEDRLLLEQALTHRSLVNEDVSAGLVDNESMEFLGDAVLGLAVSDQLFREFPECDEGYKSKVKSQLVSLPTLAKLGNVLGLGGHMLLGRGEEKTGGRQKPSLMADAFEAIVAAIYLDGGYACAFHFVEVQFQSDIKGIRIDNQAPAGTVDYKSALQEWVQGVGRKLPNYRLAGTAGPDHEKVFTVEVLLDGLAVATGEGGTKKEAEQESAKVALQLLQKHA